jgi:cytochrome c-type biogenesis protein CcmH/NrfF
MRTEMRITKVVLALALIAVPVLAQTAAEKKARVEKLEGSLLAPCCYTEPVSRHQSEVAMKMRVEIARWVDEGRSDGDIVAAYQQLYGAKVYAPPKPVGLWVYLVPWLVLLAGGYAAVQWLRHRLAPPAPAGA